MKPFFPAVVALVVGIVLGAWQPRGELLAMRAELDEARAEAAKPCRGGAARSIRSILRADTEDLEDARPPRGDEEPVMKRRADAPTQDEAELEPEPAEDPEGVAEAAPPAETPEEVREAMNTALEARRAQALAALIEQGGLEEAEITAVEGAMAQMNQELKAEVDAFVEEAVANGDVDRREIMDFAAEALDIVIAADDRMRSALPADVYASVDDSAVDPFSYVSGSTLDALVRLEGISGPVFGE